MRASRVITYNRVSRKEQAEEGFSIETQLKFLRDYASENNLEIVKEFVEVESAKRFQIYLADKTPKKPTQNCT